MMFTSFAYQFILAWIMAFIVKSIGGVLFMGNSIMEALIGGIIIVLALFILFNKFKSTKTEMSVVDVLFALDVQVLILAQVRKKAIKSNTH